MDKEKQREKKTKNTMKTMNPKDEMGRGDERKMTMINNDNADESKLILVYLFCNFLRCLSIQ